MLLLLLFLDVVCFFVDVLVVDIVFFSCVVARAAIVEGATCFR